MSFYVADVFGYIMTGPPLVCQCLRVYLEGPEGEYRYSRTIF